MAPNVAKQITGSFNRFIPILSVMMRYIARGVPLTVIGKLPGHALNPADVVAAVPVEPYKVLPAGMGLSQLVGQGAARPFEHGRYLLLRDIDRIPPGMGGAHSAVLVLDEGINRPPGKPVHGCVVTLAEAAKWSGPHICHELRKPPERVSPRVNR